MESNNDVSVLIVSCDKFYDTWEIVSRSFELYWPDCPFNVYLLTNNKIFNYRNIKGISVGFDLDWSTNLILALEKIPTKNVILWLDDVFLSAKVNSLSLGPILEFHSKKKANFIRLRTTNPPAEWETKDIGVISALSPYRVSVFATLWRKEYLKKILIPGENPWQFELRGTEQAKIHGGFYCVRVSLFSYVHGIEKGKWIRSAVAWLNRSSFHPDLIYREQMTRIEHFGYVLSKFKGFTIALLPENKRKVVLSIVKKYTFLQGSEKKATIKISRTQ